jgi:hypothetical protein
LDPQRNRFLVTWIDSRSLQPYFSQVNVDSVDVVVDWAEPLKLPAAGEESGWPQVAVDTNGDILVVSSAPVNDSRGVYTTRSADGGVTWQEPVMVFDGVAEEWPLVGQTQLQITDDGVYYLLVKRPLSLSEIDEAELFVLQSSDSGQSWTTPVPVSNAIVSWSRLVVPQSGNPHVVYQEDNGLSITTWHSYSLDEGVTWTPAVPVFDSTAGSVPAAVIPVDEQNLQMFFMVDGGIQSRWWDGQHWLITETRELDGDTPFIAIDAALNQGQANVIYVNEPPLEAVLNADAEADDAPAGDVPVVGDELYALTYTIDESTQTGELVPAAQPVETPAPEPTAEFVDTAVDLLDAPAPIPIAPFENSSALPATPGPSNQIMTMVLSVGLALLLVLFVFVIVLIIRTRKNRPWKS